MYIQKFSNYVAGHGVYVLDWKDAEGNLVFKRLTEVSFPVASQMISEAIATKCNPAFPLDQYSGVLEKPESWMKLANKEFVVIKDNLSWDGVEILYNSDGRYFIFTGKNKDIVYYMKAHGVGSKAFRKLMNMKGYSDV